MSIYGLPFRLPVCAYRIEPILKSMNRHESPIAPTLSRWVARAPLLVLVLPHHAHPSGILKKSKPPHREIKPDQAISNQIKPPIFPKPATFSKFPAAADLFLENSSAATFDFPARLTRAIMSLFIRGIYRWRFREHPAL
jgi:hypothetical protein